MFLVVGLGNPGREHENDRHNVGFMVVETFARRMGAAVFRSKFDALWARGTWAGQEVGLLLPQTFMNASGRSVQAAVAFFKAGPAELVVVHDELDLPSGEVRLKRGGGHAGHNGVRSVIERLGTADFIRIRVGIGKPPPIPVTAAGATPKAQLVRDFVLSSFTADERAALPDVIERAIDAIGGVVTT